MLKVLDVLKIILLSIILSSCSSIEQIALKDAETKRILRNIVKNNPNKVYYKTITLDGDKPIVSYVNQEYLEFYLCKKGIDSVIKIPKNEIKFIKEKFKTHKVLKLDKLLPKLKDKLSKKEEKLKTQYISIPVLFRNNTMALYYNLETYGGEFTLMQKNNGKWNVICGRSVWVE